MYREDLGEYEFKPFTKKRENIMLIVEEGRRKHSLRALLEVDVTKARELIRKLKEEGRDVSFTGWLIKCVAQAVGEHRLLNAYRQGRRKIVVFKDVDIPIPVERMIDGKPVLAAYIIRRANEKTIMEITEEIRRVQREEIDESTTVLGETLTRIEKIIIGMPLFMKRILLRLIRYRGLFKKKHMGTVGVTSVGMKGRLPGWVLTLGGATPTAIAVGGITRKPGVVDDKIMIREYLHLAVTVDHDIVDGAPLARFADRLVELLEDAYGLTTL